MGPIAMASPYAALGGGIVLSLGGILGMNRTHFDQIEKRINGVKIYETINSNSRILSFSAVVAGMGLTISPLIASTLMFYPAVLPKALMASTAVFAGCSAFAYLRPKSSLLYL